MLKINFKKMLIVFIFIICFPNAVIATQEEILKSQSEVLNIKGFIEEANKYTKDVFSERDVNNLINDAIQGNVNNKNLMSKILNLFGTEVGQTIKIVRKYSCSYCNT